MVCNKHRSGLWIVLFLILTGQWGMAQSHEALTLPSRVDNSEYVVDGRVIASECVYGRDGLIYTRNKIKVANVYKGGWSQPFIFLYTRGGEIDGNGLEVCPSLKLSIDQMGMFFIHEKTDLLLPSRPFFATEIGYGFTPYTEYMTHDLILGSKPLHEWVRIVSQQTKSPPIEISPLWSDQDSPEEMMPAITSISPLTTQAGRGKEITINGSGFLSTRGTGVVFFRNVNGSSNTINIRGITYNQWTDTQIKVIVPAQAANGGIIVQNNLGQRSAKSTQSLTVEYNILNSSAGEELRLVDDDSDGNGGYTFMYSTETSNGGVDITADSDVMDAIERAAATWHSGVTDFAIYTGESCGTTTAQTPGRDNINLISFDSDAWDLDKKAGNSVLGVMYTYFTRCGSSEFEVEEMDMILRRDGNPNGIGGSVNWNYGPGAPSGGESDFETVVLHEFGHGRMLGHTRVSGAVMFPSIQTGTQNRALQNSEKDGGSYVQQESKSYSPPVIPACGGRFALARQYDDYDAGQSCDIALPIQLLSFSGTELPNNQIELHWETTSQNEQGHIELQRKSSTIDFEGIHRIAQGPSIGPTSTYNFVDRNLPIDQEINYRLKIEDISGYVEYSPILSFQIKNDQFKLFIVRTLQNWIANWDPVQVKGSLDFSLIDLNGKRLGSWSKSNNDLEGQLTIDHSNFPSGAYILHINFQGREETHILVK